MFRVIDGLADFAAAVVMSHHLESDLQYLRALAHSAVPYVGLLGPAARREKLLADLGADAALLRPRLRAPVGLDIGGRSPSPSRCPSLARCTRPWPDAAGGRSVKSRAELRA